MEEYSPKILCIKGTDNEAADALSRLILINSDVKKKQITRENLSERYCVSKLDRDTFPLTYLMIDKYKRKDKELVEKLKCANYRKKYLCGGGNTFMLIFKNNETVVPKII